MPVLRIEGLRITLCIAAYKMLILLTFSSFYPLFAGQSPVSSSSGITAASGSAPSKSTPPSVSEIQLTDQPKVLAKPKPPPKNHLGTTEYQPISYSLEGEISVHGSRRLEPMLTEWLQLFQLIYENVITDIKAEGSGTAPDALMSGAANIGAMSRPMNKEERDAFKEKKGYDPIEIQVALDALAVYVNWKNPLKLIDIPQIDAIFSKTRECGETQAINNWKSLDWADGGQIQIQQLHKEAGGRNYFKDKTLCGGEYKKGTKEGHKNVEDVIIAIAQQPAAIGYTAFDIGDYKSRMLKIARAKEFPYYAATVNNIQTGKYPLSRYLYLYIDSPQSKTVNPMMYEFLKLIFSSNGQAIIQTLGAVPLPPKLIGQQLSKLKNGLE